MDISLIIALIWLKTFMSIAEICMEGSMSQHVDVMLCFCFMLCRRLNFGEKKYTKNHPFFNIK